MMDLKKMLSHIEEILLSTLHLPISSEDTLCFYCYLHKHVLITNKQFLLLTDVPTQDRSQQLSRYKIFTLDIPHCNFTACYDVNTKCLRITQDETMAVEISSQQFRICQEANGQSCIIPTPFQPLAKTTILHCCHICQEYSQHFSQMFLTNQEIFRYQYALTTCPQCLDINNNTVSSSSYNYIHMPRRDNTVY